MTVAQRLWSKSNSIGISMGSILPKFAAPLRKSGKRFPPVSRIMVALLFERTESPWSRTGRIHPSGRSARARWCRTKNARLPNFGTNQVARTYQAQKSWRVFARDGRVCVKRRHVIETSAVDSSFLSVALPGTTSVPRRYYVPCREHYIGV